MLRSTKELAGNNTLHVLATSDAVVTSEESWKCIWPPLYRFYRFWYWWPA
jgi:hypothetical protein